jgi:hypothetical protein
MTRAMSLARTTTRVCVLRQTIADLQPYARDRKISTWALVRLILETAVHDKIIDAILDDRRDSGVGRAGTG